MIHTGGCSLTAGFNTEHNWTDHLGVPVTNHAAIAGSNQRTWRRLHDAVQEGARRLIMQITTVERKEWWIPPTSAARTHYVENYRGEHTFKFKYGSHIDNPDPITRKASKINYNFVSEQWEHDDFMRQHRQFDAWCAQQGVETLYLASRKYISPHPEHCLDVTEILEQHHLPNDPWHLSELGHQVMAARVLDHITSTFPHWLD